MNEEKTPIELKAFAYHNGFDPSKRDRQNLALKILCAMIRVPDNLHYDYDTMSDMAVRQADSLIKKLNEPEI